MYSGETIRLKALASVVLLLSACSYSDLRDSLNPGVHEQEPTGHHSEPVATSEPVKRVEHTKLVSEVAVLPAANDVPVSDMWHYLAAEFTWTSPDDLDVQSEIDLLAKYPRHLEDMSLRAEPYLWFIVESLKERDLPVELALLPVIESGYQPNIVSPGGAAGLWQFTPQTGRHFGLQQSRQFDRRRDIVASTNAALDYLSELHDVFDGDWLLALAAYNCGPARVQRAMESTSSREFQIIAAELPPTTRRYVAKLLAASAIIQNPSTYDISLSPIANSQRFTEIDLDGPADISTVVRDGIWSEQSFKRLNPAFSSTYIESNGPFKILVPTKLEASIVEHLASNPPHERDPIKTHRVAANETLSEIASRYGVSVKGIKARNKLHDNVIRVGSELVITGSSITKPDPGKQRIAETSAHVVQNGDSFWTISQQYGVSPTALAKLNGMSTNRSLQIGQVLKVGAPDNMRTYDVAHGDSLWTIARKFNVTIEQLEVWNKLSRRHSLQPGQTLVIAPTSGRA
ncbi:MAG: LysM peptidoglycan-binding domain-containing protein [Proteobacteria bacterium]|nr:LysM peptidoglycan-binding domain-containing protein [Pseudomonadota bacterium]